MFRPSNLNDKHLSEMEYQDWERERDTKKDDFPFIQLSKPELNLLKKVSKDWVEVTEENNPMRIGCETLRLSELFNQKINRKYAPASYETGEQTICIT